jgi:hypothetical protein
MRFTIMAVAVGLVLGFLAGGRLRHLSERSFRWWSLLAAGLVAQLLSGLLEGRLGLGLLGASYALLAAFAALNVRLVGMWLVALGIGLNLLTIVVNGGMPVRASAIVAAGIAQPDEVESLDFGTDGKRHLERPSDRLMLISDIIPVRPLKQVFSFGDLMMSVGAGNVVFHLVQPRRARVAEAPAR